MKLKLLINPKLPKHFFNRDNSLRSAAELNKYWDVPIILIDEYKDNETWEDYQERTAGVENEFIKKNEADFNSWIQEKKELWFKNYPTGIAYTVHCLDGGAWDRPTWWGDFGSLEEAKACCENGPSWQNKSGGGVAIKSMKHV